MKLFRKYLFYVGISFLLSSCEFQCSMGDTKDAPPRKKVSSSVVEKGDVTVTNNIYFTTRGDLKVKKATLLPDGERCLTIMLLN